MLRAESQNYENARAVQLRKREAVHTKKWQEAIRLPAIFQFVKADYLEGHLDSEFHRARRADGEDTGAKADKTGTAGAFRRIGRAAWLVELRRSVDGVRCAIQRSCQQCVRAVVVLAVEKIVERRLWLDTEALPTVDWLDRPTEPDIKRKEGVVSNISRRSQGELRATSGGGV